MGTPITSSSHAHIKVNCDNILPSEKKIYDVWSMADSRQSFQIGPVCVSNGHAVPAYERYPLVRLILAAHLIDPYPRYMFKKADPLKVLGIIRHMLDDWIESQETLVLIAETYSKEGLKELLGWICCSIIRRNTNYRDSFETNGLTNQYWTVATAMRLKAEREAQRKRGKFFAWTDKSLPENPMIDEDHILTMDCQACISTQRNVFPKLDYLVMNSFAVHPNCAFGFTVAAKLLDGVFELACAQNMPMLVPSGGDAMEGLFRDCYGFQEKGATIHFQHVPYYSWKFLSWKPGMRTTPKTREERERERRIELNCLAAC